MHVARLDVRVHADQVRQPDAGCRHAGGGGGGSPALRRGRLTPLIVSGTSGAADVRAAVRAGGGRRAAASVVPLFESIDDLRDAPRSWRAAGDERYRQLEQRRGHGDGRLLRLGQGRRLPDRAGGDLPRPAPAGGSRPQSAGIPLRSSTAAAARRAAAAARPTRRSSPSRRATRPAASTSPSRARRSPSSTCHPASPAATWSRPLRGAAAGCPGRGTAPAAEDAGLLDALSARRARRLSRAGVGRPGVQRLLPHLHARGGAAAGQHRLAAGPPLPGPAGLRDLRAIPWVFAWTQTRARFRPGSAWARPRGRRGRSRRPGPAAGGLSRLAVLPHAAPERRDGAGQELDEVSRLYLRLCGGDADTTGCSASSSASTTPPATACSRWSRAGRCSIAIRPSSAASPCETPTSTPSTPSRSSCSPSGATPGCGPGAAGGGAAAGAIDRGHRGGASQYRLSATTRG